METTPLRCESPVSRAEGFPSTTHREVLDPPGGQTPLAATGGQLKFQLQFEHGLHVLNVLPIFFQVRYF